MLKPPFWKQWCSGVLHRRAKGSSCLSMISVKGSHQPSDLCIIRGLLQKSIYEDRLLGLFLRMIGLLGPLFLAVSGGWCPTDVESMRRRGRQRMRWLDDITDSMDMSLTPVINIQNFCGIPSYPNLIYRKNINVAHHIIRLLNKNQILASIDTKRYFEKPQYFLCTNC